MSKHSDTLSERFWRIARGMDGTGIEGDSVDPVAIVKHVLSILDALDRGEQGAPVSVHTLSFLKMLREAENTGDLSYAAPEQICGDMLDERSLVFSVGVLLFERLTGRHPFGAEGKPQRRVARIRRGEFGSGVNYFPTVPSALRTILMKAMGPFPEERWNSLRELRSRLDQFVDLKDESVHLPGATQRRPRTRVPLFASESTKVVDMSQHVRAELMAAAGMKSVSGELQASPEPRPLPVAPVSVETAAEISAALMPKRVETDYVPNLRPRAPRGVKPLLYIGMGAAIASVAFMVWSGRSDSGAAATAAGASPAAYAATPDEVAAATTPTSSAADDQKRDDAATVPTTATDETPAPKATPTLAVFDAEAAARKGLDASRACFTGKQIESGVAFGMGVLFSKDGAMKRVYFAGTDELPYKTRRCLSAALTNVTVAVGPPSRRIVDYYIRLRGDTTTIKTK